LHFLFRTALSISLCWRGFCVPGLYRRRGVLFVDLALAMAALGVAVALALDLAPSGGVVLLALGMTFVGAAPSRLRGRPRARIPSRLSSASCSPPRRQPCS
jgi:hypothetical protein